MSAGQARLARGETATARSTPDSGLPHPSPIASRVAAIDWKHIATELDGFGVAKTGVLLAPGECTAIASGYGKDEYKYYAYSLPGLVGALRSALYPPLAAVANRWEEAFGRPGDYPQEHAAYLARCHAAGQRRPTPLLLRYGEGDYNCLHQDLYGALAFPLQVAFLLSAPGEDFTGGEFVLTEQRPRMQSRAEVVSLRQGEGVIFAVNQRPVQGGRGVYRVTMRHGVSRLRSGERFTLGIIFHDAA
jgi:hypothetical protein